jgi:Flp pilus assembly protein CpaB
MSHILIAVAALFAFGLNYLALEDRDASTLVAVADKAIAEGVPFTADLVRLTPIPSDFEALEHLVLETDIDRLHGWVVSRSVAEGELLDRGTVIRPGDSDGLRTMSIPVAVEHAVGATLVIGDRIDVISMLETGPAVIASDLEVVAIAEAESGGLTAAGTYHLVVAVTTEEALALAQAIDLGSIEILRSTGAHGPEGESG